MIGPVSLTRKGISSTRAPTSRSATEEHAWQPWRGRPACSASRRAVDERGRKLSLDDARKVPTWHLGPPEAGFGYRCREALERRQARVGHEHPEALLAPNVALAASLPADAQRPVPTRREVSGESRARHPSGRGCPHDGAHRGLGWNVIHVTESAGRALHRKESAWSAPRSVIHITKRPAMPNSSGHCRDCADRMLHTSPECEEHLTGS